jgi:hypothetical protein
VCDLSFDRFSFVFGREKKKMRATFFRLAILEKMKSRCAGGGYRMTRGVYCLAKQHPLRLGFFGVFLRLSLVVVYTNDYCARRRGGRQAVVIISTLHFF